MLRLRKTFQIVALIVGVLSSWTNISSAVSVTWDGGGADNNWSTDGNWTGGGGGNPPNGNDTINFAGSTRLSNTNNFVYVEASGTNVAINFISGANAFTLNGNQMALTAGVANNSANIQTLNLNIALAGANTWAANNNDIVMNGVLSGANTLTKTGANDLILTAANTYTSATTISVGTLNVRNNTGLGTTAGGVTVNATGAALELQGGISVGAEALTLNGTGVSSGGALRNISGNNTYGGLVTLGSASRINSDSGTLSLANTGTISGAFGLTVGGSGDTVLNSILGTGAGTLTKDGAGKLTLTGGNTYTGATAISNGVLNVQNSTGLGTTAGGVTVANLAALELQNGISVGAEALTLNGTGVSSGGALRNISGNNTYGGLVTLGSAIRINSDSGTLSLANAGTITGAFGLTVGGAGDTVLSSILGTGAGTLTKDGAGKLTLTGGNTYTGATTISVGTLNVRNNTGLGTTAGGTTVANLAALELQNGISVGAEALTLNGAGVLSGGALRNISGNNTYGGLVTLGSASRINSDSGTLSLTNAATITGNTFGLTVGGAGDTVLNSILGTTSGSLTKDGAGKLTLGAANTFTGLTTVSNGTLAYGVGNALSSGALTVNGASAVLDVGTFSDTVGAVTLTSGSITGTTGVLTGTSFAMSGAGSASAILGGSGATLTKTGVGTTTTLSKTNSYTGATTVTSGTLNVATGGSIASSSSTVAAGAAMVVNGTAGAVTLNGSLSGAGTVGALELNNGSSLNPGNSPGLLSASSSKWNAGATYNFQMTSATGTAGTNWDLLDVSTLLDLSALSSSAKFNLNIDTAGPLTGYDVNTPFAWTFAQSGSLALPSGYAFVSPLAVSSIDITSLFNLTFIDATSFTGAVTSGFKIIAYNDPNGSERIVLVPEPSTGSLLLFGFGGLALLRMVRRRSVG